MSQTYQAINALRKGFKGFHVQVLIKNLFFRLSYQGGNIVQGKRVAADRL